MIRESRPAVSIPWSGLFRVAVLVGLVFLAGSVAYLWLGPTPEAPEKPPKEKQAAVKIHDGLHSASERHETPEPSHFFS